MKGRFHERGVLWKGVPWRIPLSGQQAGGILCYHYFSALLFSTAFSLKIHSSLVFALSYKDVIFRSNLSTQHKKRKKSNWLHYSSQYDILLSGRKCVIFLLSFIYFKRGINTEIDKRTIFVLLPLNQFSFELI